MKTNRKFRFLPMFIGSLLVFFVLIGCKKDDDSDLAQATFPVEKDVFTDGLGSSLTFDVFAGSDTSAGFISFEETTTTANNSSKAIRAQIPASASGYASGVFRSSFGRDLSSFNVLTFYAKASSAVTLNELGYGVDFNGDPNKVTFTNLPITTSWEKYYIPIPNASVLTAEKGMFYYSESEASAYTLYLDEIQFENLGTIAQGIASINSGNDDTISAYVNETVTINNFSATFNDPNANDITVSLSSSYFDFESSNTSVATVTNGEISVVGTGTATITAMLGGISVSGSITIESQGTLSAAPTPTLGADSVISLFSDAYTDVTVDTWRTSWSSGTLEDISLNGNATKKYSNLSFVGIETTSSTVDASSMTHIHFDVYSDDFTEFKIKLVDFGPTGGYSGSGGDGQGDDSEHELTYSTPTQGQWISYDIPLDDFVGLTATGNIAQYIISTQPAGSATIFIDNIYFYSDGNYQTPIPSTPTTAAPTPTELSANVISLFSDAYTDVSVDTWRTSWSSATFEDVMVASNATKKYSGLSFVGIETTSSTVDAFTMTHLHIDIWTADATTFSIKLVDFGPTGGYSGAGGDGQGDDTEHQLTFTSPTQGQWVSYDIPLSDFTGLTAKSNLAQYILSAQPAGSTTVYVDNFYFYATAP